MCGKKPLKFQNHINLLNHHILSEDGMVTPDLEVLRLRAPLVVIFHYNRDH